MNLLFAGAIMALLAGHLMRTTRWTQIVEIYEKPNIPVLLRSIILGYFVCFLFPFHVGDIVRAVLAGKSMRNGISFSLATIVVERYMDIMTVCVMYIAFLLFGIASKTVVIIAGVYILLAVMLFIFSVIAIKSSEILKSIILKFSLFFNTQIQLHILTFSWAVISSLKDIFKHINKLRFFLSTVLMWLFYIVSYNLLSLAFSSGYDSLTFLDIFNLLFAGNSSVSLSTLAWSNNSIFYRFGFLLIAVYMLSPLLIILVISFVFSTNASKASIGETTHKNLLPQITKWTRLDFLKVYFSDERREYIENYLKINRNINVLQDVSAGSNATTLLCIDLNYTFYRKYAFGAESEKLHKQINWMERYQTKLPLTRIDNVAYENGYCYYDMPYTATSIDLFTYMHTMPIENSWDILSGAIRDLEENLYSDSLHKADKANVGNYISSKVLHNLKRILNYSDFKHILKYDELIINGRRYNNLGHYMEYFTDEYLAKMFLEDRCADIHGDLTIENIICTYNYFQKRNYFLIDPNPENIHNSPNLDYAKVLQSLHGNYEFLMKTENYIINKNSIEFLFTRSTAYSTLFELYQRLLDDQFSPETIRSIYFHEIIHWLRLIPHKMEQDPKRAPIFYAGMIMVINDIFNKLEEICE